MIERAARAVSVLALAIWLLLAANRTSTAGDPFEAFAVQAVPEPGPSPMLSLPDLTGRVVAVPEEFRGKVVLLGFFTTT